MKKSTLIIIGVLVLILTDLIYGSYKFKQAKNLTSNSNDKTTSEAKETEPQKENESPNTLVFVGDIMLSRTVGTKILKTGDVNSPFLKTASVTQNADVAFANLESPFLDTGARMTAGMVFKAEPDTVAGLVYAGFDIVSLANNHFGNQGQKGMAYTFSLLKKNNINYVGAGENSTRAAEPKIIEKNGLKFAFCWNSHLARSHGILQLPGHFKNTRSNNFAVMRFLCRCIKNRDHILKLFQRSNIFFNISN